MLNLIISNISGHWLKIKKLVKKYGKTSVNLQRISTRVAIETTHSIAKYHKYHSIALFNEVQCKFTAAFTVFFNNFFIFSQLPLIFDIIKFNTNLYRYLLKFLKIVWYSSIVLIVSEPCPSPEGPLMVTTTLVVMWVSIKVSSVWRDQVKF